MEFNFKMADVHEVKRAGHTVAVDVTKLPPHIVAELAAHGLTQKIGDAAAGKQGDEALAAMQKVMDALHNGEWGVKRTGGGAAGLSDLQVEMAKVFIKATKMQFPKGTPTATRYEKALEDVAERSEEERAAIEKVAKRLIERAKEDAAMLGGLSIDF